MDQLRLSQHARVIPASPDCIYWMTESKQGYWSAPHVGELASLLAAPATEASVLERCPDAAPVLDGLLRRGLIEFASSPPALVQLCRESGISTEYGKRTRWKEGVTILDLSQGTASEVLRLAFGPFGVAVGENVGLRVVVMADYLDPRLDRLREERQLDEIPWALAKLVGEEVWAGPIFVPGQTACWRCLEPRLRENSWLRSQIAPDGRPLLAPYESAGRLRAGAEFAAQEIARWLLEAPDSIEGTVWSFSWATLQSRRHAVVRLPNCPACGTTALGSPKRIDLESATLPSNQEFRCSTPQAVIDRLQQLASPITGILRRFERRDLAPSPAAFTWGAVYNVALPPKELRIPGAILEPAVCSGRGWSVDQAKAVCLAEAVERYSQQFRGDERRIAARYSDFGGQAIHPGPLLLFSEMQYANRERWNVEHSPDEAVPERFDESEQVEWTQGWSLTAQEPRFLPVALCSQYYRPAGKRWLGDGESNGCAAGSRIEEAILYGLLELVERDALAIWWFNRVIRPAFGPEAIADSVCRSACEQLREDGWNIRLADITTDLAIPVFVSVASRNGNWIRSSGCHLNRAAALRQAIGELWQLSKAPSRPGSPPQFGEAAQPPLPELTVLDLKTVIEDCCRKLTLAGHDVAVFDLTRPEIAFPVVRVVVPGLRSNKPRFGPGRLYDVPVRLGWLPEPRTEEEFPVQSA